MKLLSSFLCASAFCVAMAGSGFAQDGFEIALATKSQNQEHNLEVIDRHIIFMVDVSESVDVDEYRLMMGGLAESLTTGEVKNYFDSGAVDALTLILYAGKSRASETAVIKSSSDAQAFVETYIWDTEHNRPIDPRFSRGGTSIYNAYQTAKAVMDAEEKNGLRVLERAVVVLGDGPENQNIKSSLSAETEYLATHYNAVSYAVPVVTKKLDAIAYFKWIKTSEDFIAYFEREIALPGHDKRDASQRLHVADGFQGIKNAVVNALNIVLS